jgi:hypothetical protein
MADKILTLPVPVALETPQAVIAIRALFDSLFRIDRQYLPAGPEKNSCISLPHERGFAPFTETAPGAKPPDRAAPKS